MIQREREAEGDEFADRDQFVTQAYKDQMAEVRRAEEEEKKREGTIYGSVPRTIRLMKMPSSVGEEQEGHGNGHDALLPATSRAV